MLSSLYAGGKGDLNVIITRPHRLDALHSSLGGRLREPSGRPGRGTNKGVTQKVYDGWRTRQGLPRARRPADRGRRDARDLRGRLLAAAALRSAAARLDLVQFDTAVNMGPKRAVRFLQRAVGCGVDGDFGPATERAASSCDLGNAVTAYCNAREAFYRRLAQKNPKLQVFLKGWMNRLNALRNEAGLPGYEAVDAAWISATPATSPRSPTSARTRHTISSSNMDRRQIPASRSIYARGTQCAARDLHSRDLEQAAGRRPAAHLGRDARRCGRPLPLGDLGVTSSLVYWADLLYDPPERTSRRTRACSRTRRRQSTAAATRRPRSRGRRRRRRSSRASGRR